MTLTLDPTPRVRGRWVPGQSGNPKGGKPRSERSAADIAREYTVDAIKALVISLRYQSTRVPAAIALLDRGWGKPQVTVSGQLDVNVLHLVAAQMIGEELATQTIEGESKPIPHDADAAR